MDIMYSLTYSRIKGLIKRSRLLIPGCFSLIVSCGDALHMERDSLSRRSHSELLLRDSELRGQIVEQGNKPEDQHQPHQDTQSSPRNMASESSGQEAARESNSDGATEPLAEHDLRDDRDPTGDTPKDDEYYRPSAEPIASTPKTPELASELCNGQDDDGDGLIDEYVTNVCGACGTVLDSDSDGVADCQQETITVLSTGPAQSRIDFNVALVNAPTNKQAFQLAAMQAIEAFLNDPIIAPYQNYFNVTLHWYENINDTKTINCELAVFDQWQNCFANKYLTPEQSDLLLVFSGAASAESFATSPGAAYGEASDSTEALLAKIKTALSYLYRGTPQVIETSQSATNAQIKLGIYEMTGLIDSVDPVNQKVTIADDTTAPQIFSITTKVPQDLDLKISWTLDDQPLAADDQMVMTLASSDLSSGVHILAVKVSDQSMNSGLDPFSRLQSVHKWTILVGSQAKIPDIFSTDESHFQMRVDDNFASRALVSNKIIDGSDGQEYQVTTTYEKYLFLPFMIDNGDAVITKHMAKSADGYVGQTKTTYINNNYSFMNYSKSFEPAVARLKLPLIAGDSWYQEGIKEHTVTSTGEEILQIYNRKVKVMNEEQVITTSGPMTCRILFITKTVVTKSNAFSKSHFECWHPTLGMIKQSDSWGSPSAQTQQQGIIRVESH